MMQAGRQETIHSRTLICSHRQVPCCVSDFWIHSAIQAMKLGTEKYFPIPEDMKTILIEVKKNKAEFINKAIAELTNN